MKPKVGKVYNNTHANQFEEITAIKNNTVYYNVYNYNCDFLGKEQWYLDAFLVGDIYECSFFKTKLFRIIKGLE